MLSEQRNSTTVFAPEKNARSRTLLCCTVEETMAR